MSKQSLKPLAVAFGIGGIWDALMGLSYIFLIGTGRLIDQPPPLDLFYAVFLGSFFLCFAYLQILSALNVRRYAFNTGCIIFGRMFYVIQLTAFSILQGSLPAPFWFGAIIDTALVVSFASLAVRGGLRIHDLFLPQREGALP
jgi:hypothetical protein